MPIDFASGFNLGGYDPTGFAGRARGGYFPSIYGYDDQGNKVTNRDQMAQINAQRNAPPAIPSNSMGNLPPASSNPNADFFAQLANLMGVPAQGAAVNPGSGGYATGPYGPQSAANEAARMQGLRDASQGFNMVTGGGQGPGGGVSREVQRGGMAGRMAASGRASQGRRPQVPVNNKGPMRAPKGPMRAPGAMKPMPVPDQEATYGRAPGLIPGNTPSLTSKNPLDAMSSLRRGPSVASRMPKGRTAPSRANFNYQMGGNG